MARYKDLTGSKFGKLTAESYAGINSLGGARWLCLCECGGIKTANAAELARGNTQSCGCLAVEQRRDAAKTQSHPYSRVNMRRERKPWENMIDRCYNQSNSLFHRYGARGIVVCTAWRESFKAFADDMGARPEGTTLDRINNDLGYSPENCRWVDMTVQANNRGNNHWIVINGESKTISQWAKVKGVSPFLIHTRLYLGWSEHDAVTLQKGTRRN